MDLRQTFFGLLFSDGIGRALVTLNILCSGKPFGVSGDLPSLHAGSAH